MKNAPQSSKGDVGSSGWCVWAEAGTGSISRSVGSAPPLLWVPLVSDLRSLREKEVGVPRTRSHGHEHDHMIASLAGCSIV